MREILAAALPGAVALALGLAPLPASAEITVLTSKQPYWEVGEKDKALSQACALGRFTVQKADALVARFTGPKGADTLNVAKGSGRNLRDLDKKAKKNEDYFFKNQNTTSCEVYVGGRGKKAKG